MVIRISDLVTSCDTADQGDVVLTALCKALSQDRYVALSFSGMSTATSSFVNAAFVRLLEAMSFDEIKARIAITASTRQINEMIRYRLRYESEKTNKAVA